MYQTRSPWSTPSQRDSSAAIQITSERLGNQLTAVIELCKHNATYLEDYEIAWINSIIDSATASVFSTLDSDPSVQPEKSSLRDEKWLREKLSARHLRSRFSRSSQSSHHNDLENLLEIAKSLNSAINLLSCCYDRWCWLKSKNLTGSGRQRNDQTSHEVEDFLDWTRRSNTPGSSSTHNPGTHETQPPATSPMTQGLVVSRFQSYDGSPDTLLSLLADSTIEKWRQNAEDALAATSARLQSDAWTRRLPNDLSAVANSANSILSTHANRDDHDKTSTQTDAQHSLTDSLKPFAFHRIGSNAYHTAQQRHASSQVSCCCACTLPKILDVRQQVPTPPPSSSLSSCSLLSVSESASPPLIPQNRPQPSLQNSYGKEPLSTNARTSRHARHQSHITATQNPHVDQRMFSEPENSNDSMNHSRSIDTWSQPSALTSRSTLVHEGSTGGLDLTSSVSRSGTEGSITGSSSQLFQPMVSFHGQRRCSMESSNGGVASISQHRSRGRMWLEQQV